jgi:hypothetical protein
VIVGADENIAITGPSLIIRTSYKLSNQCKERLRRSRPIIIGRRGWSRVLDFGYGLIAERVS